MSRLGAGKTRYHGIRGDFEQSPIVGKRRNCVGAPTDGNLAGAGWHHLLKEMSRLHAGKTRNCPRIEANFGTIGAAQKSLDQHWATNALKRGLDSLTVAILMGHQDPSMLAKVYQHLSHNPEHLLDQARRAAM